jgi:hypothetical protein
MKKGFSLMGLIAVLMVLAILVVPLQSAQAQTPVEKTFTIGLTASYASTNYTAGFNAPALSAFKPMVLDVMLYATNATITLKRSVLGTAYFSYAMGTSTNAILFVNPTNEFYFLRGDTIVVSLGATNIAGIVKVQGLEQ